MTLSAGENALYVSVDDELADVIILRPDRPRAAVTVTRLRAADAAQIAMVTGDVAPYAVVAGNPATVIRTLEPPTAEALRAAAAEGGGAHAG